MTTTSAPDVIPPEGLLPPPFMSARKPWMSSNTSTVNHDINNVPYQEHRVGFHPVVGGSGTKSQIFTTGNRTSGDMASTKGPSISQSSIPFVNSLVATYLIFIIVISVSSNLLVMLVTSRKRPRGRSKSNRVCILSLAMADILFSLLNHTVIAAASLGFVDMEKVFGGHGCNYYGVGAMFFGTFSMCVHASVSIIRYVNICHPEKVEWFQLKYVYLFVFTSVVYASGWAVGPFLEWGRYDTYEFGCTITISESSKKGRMYVTLAILCLLLLPLGILITCYALIVVQALRFQKELGRFTSKERCSSKQRLSSRHSLLKGSLKRRSDNGSTRKKSDTKEEEKEETVEEMTTEEEELKDEEEVNNEKRESIKNEFIFDKGSVRRTQRSLRLQAKLIRLSMVIAGAYLIAWMPYATVCIWLSYGNSVMMPEGLRIGASLFCKSATAYNPFIYFFMSESFRQDVRNFCCRRKRKSSKLGVPLHVSVTGLPSHPASIRSLEAASLRSRSNRGDSFCQRVPSIRKSPTSTIASINSEVSLDSSAPECASLSPLVDGTTTFRLSPRQLPDNKGMHHLMSPSSPIPLYRMRSLPHSVSPTRSPSCVRRLSSNPYTSDSRPKTPLSRRSSFNVPAKGPSFSNSEPLTRVGLAGHVSSYSLRLPPKASPKLDRRRGKPLSQSFRAPGSTTRVTVHRRESWMGLRSDNYQSKSAREIQRDLESIISNEFHGDLNLKDLTFEHRKEERSSIKRKNSIRASPGSPKLGDVPTRPISRNQRLSLHGPRRTNNGSVKRETPNFLEIPKITKTVWEQQDRGPVRSRSLHGRPTDYKNEHSKQIYFSEY